MSISHGCFENMPVLVIFALQPCSNSTACLCMGGELGYICLLCLGQDTKFTTCLGKSKESLVCLFTNHQHRLLAMSSKKIAGAENSIFKGFHKNWAIPNIPLQMDTCWLLSLHGVNLYIVYTCRQLHVAVVNWSNKSSSYCMVFCSPAVVFKVYDVDRDGKISKEDLKDVSQNQLRCSCKSPSTTITHM